MYEVTTFRVLVHSGVTLGWGTPAWLERHEKAKVLSRTKCTEKRKFILSFIPTRVMTYVTLSGVNPIRNSEARSPTVS
eukprot:6846509-Pyramimonas_sp.AAC.3